jgi:hypothetical protein
MNGSEYEDGDKKYTQTPILRKNSNLGFAEAEIQFVSNHVDTGIGYF